MTGAKSRRTRPQPGDVMILGMAAVLLSEAKRAAARARTAGTSSEVAGGTAAAVILAYAALDAEVAEYDLALDLSTEDRERLDDANGLAARYEVLLSLRDKSLKCPKEETFKDLVCLVALRHAITHGITSAMKPGRWPRSLKSYRRRLPVTIAPDQHWTSAALTAPTATWAVELTRRWLRWTKPRMPIIGPADFGGPVRLPP